MDPPALRVDRHASRGAYVSLLTGDGHDAPAMALPLSVSISHSAARALVAAAWTDETAAAGWTVAIGADTELIASRSELFVDDFMTDAERQAWRRAPAPSRDTLANLMWSAKESVAKALQHGLRIDTRWLTCLPDTVPGERAADALPFTASLEPGDHDWRRFSVEADPRMGAERVSFSGRWSAADGYVHTIAIGARSGRGPRL